MVLGKKGFFNKWKPRQTLGIRKERTQKILIWGEIGGKKEDPLWKGQIQKEGA